MLQAHAQRKPTGANYEIQYELTDQVGNVRAVVSQGSLSATPKVDFWADYYVFGGLKPGRQYSAGSYRYEAGGLENAEGQANWSNFELRMLNKDLGRWMTPDPYGQFHSPYLAMGNNPVSNVDPDGGWVSIADLDPGHPYFYLQEILKRWDPIFKNLAMSGDKMTNAQMAVYVGEMKNYVLRLQQWTSEELWAEIWFLQSNYEQTEAIGSRIRELREIKNQADAYVSYYSGTDGPQPEYVDLNELHAQRYGNGPKGATAASEENFEPLSRDPFEKFMDIDIMGYINSIYQQNFG